MRKLLLVAAGTVLAMPALAQAPKAPPEDEVQRGDTVLSRPRPDYDPAGIRLGGFRFLPDLTIQESFNSNIFATKRNEKDDFITSIEPTLDLRSNWNNHALNFHADARIVQYAQYDDESYNDYSFGTDGKLDITRQSRLFGGLGYIVRHEPRYSPNDLGGNEPNEYSVASASLAGEQDFNRLALRLESGVDRYRYDSIRTNGRNFSQDGRDRDQVQVGLKAGYQLAPLREIYLRGAYNWRLYDDSRDESGFDRDSNGFLVALGARYDISGVTSIDAYVGYREQSYDDGRLGKVNGPTGGLRLTWNVTRLTTITAGITRDVEETNLANSSGYFATRTDVRVDHELLRNLLLNGFIAHENESFEGIGRDDNYYRTGVGAKYLLNRYLSLAGGYALRIRNSDEANDFDEHVVFLRISGHL